MSIPLTLSECVTARKSVRKFASDKPVPEGLIRDLLEKASRAPSGGNTQPWHVYVVSGNVKKEISDLVDKEFQNGNFGEKPEFHIYPKPEVQPAFMERRRKLGYEMYKLMGIARDDQIGRLNAMKENFNFFGAPVGIFITVDRVCDKNGWGHVGMFLQTFCLLAVEAGLATCLQEAWENYHGLVTKKLNIPSNEMLVCGLSLGYEDTTAKVNELRSERVPLDSFASLLGFSSKL